MTARTPTSRFHWSTPLDNHEPPRAYAHGVGDVYLAPCDEPACNGERTDGCTHGAPETVTLASSDLPFTRHTIFLLDNGVTVRPFYVAGWNVGVVHVQPFPTKHTWVHALGPQRAYHVKIHTLEES